MKEKFKKFGGIVFNELRTHFWLYAAILAHSFLNDTVAVMLALYGIYAKCCVALEIAKSERQTTFNFSVKHNGTVELVKPEGEKS